MAFCSFCSSLPANLFSTDRDKQCTINHHSSFFALQNSGAAGCELCQLFLHAIQKQTEDGEQDRLVEAWPRTGSVTLSSTKFDEQHVQIGYRQAGKFRGKIIPPGWDGPEPVNSGAVHDTQIAVINAWLDNCKSNHPECASSDPKFIPTRLIDVGLLEKQEPRLVLTADLIFKDRCLNTTSCRYLALSHCWGLTMPSTATTKSSTIAERIRSIPMSGLSKTFADFINIARRMCIQYVWIDSLCIIQDSREDWETEAAQMESVYSNAYCTIAASSSENGDGGCQVDPDSRPYGPVTLSFDETDKNGNHVLRKICVYSLFGKPIVNVLPQDPLSSRGWTFQERELSNRILHYSHDTIRWECRSLKASPQFPWQDTNAFNGTLRTFDAGQIGPKRLGEEVKVQKGKDEDAWFAAVLNYTGRALTKQSDKLPAFSGIARAVQSRTGDCYLAGLWESNIVHCLCWASAWCREGGDPVSNPKKPDLITHLRQVEYVAPSWSWACINGQVRYEWWIFNALDPEPAPYALGFMPRIVEAKTIPAGLDKYGQLKGGHIRLVGKIKPAFTRGEGFARQDREGVYDIHEGKMREVGMVRFDIPSEAPAGKNKVIICLCVLPRAERHGDSVGLALLPTGRNNEYRRVGLIFAVKLEWYESCVEGTITLI